MREIKKVLVVGYGSMGRRRIRLASELLDGAVFFCVDSSPERRLQAEEAGIRSYASLEEGLGVNPDIAFVCTSPGHHADIILCLVEAGINVFTELNLTSDRYDLIAEKAAEKGVTVFVSSTLLYKRQMEILDSLVKEQEKPLAYVYHVGQYLPDWHPWESYKDFFAGKKETNGVREILAIQLPWLIRTFGKIEKVRAISQKCTGLDIDFPDSIAAAVGHENGNMGVLLVDVVARKAVTRLEITGEDIHVFWDGHNDDLYRLDLESGQLERIKVYETQEHMEGYSDNIVEEPYRDEIRAFLETMEGKQPGYTLEEDGYVLSVVDEIERMGREQG